MRTETDLIKKIQELKDVKPSKSWVISTKKNILEEQKVLKNNFWEIFPKAVLQYRTAFVTLVIVGILAGTFGFAQNSLPGDFLYTFKRVTEKVRLSFVPEGERSRLQLSYANERLESLVKVAQTNQTKKFAPIIKEYQANILGAAKDLSKVKKPDVKEIAQKVKKIEENKKEAEALGMRFEETEELDDALAKIVESQIKDLKNRALSKKQEKLLEEAQEKYQKKNYSEALEKILLLSYSQDQDQDKDSQNNK